MLKVSVSQQHHARWITEAWITSLHGHSSNCTTCDVKLFIVDFVRRVHPPPPFLLAHLAFFLPLSFSPL